MNDRACVQFERTPQGMIQGSQAFWNSYPGRWFGLALIVLGLAEREVYSQAPKDSSNGSIKVEAEQVELLINNLAANAFEQREQASKQLMRIGEFALPQLNAALENPSAEVRRRAGNILAHVHDRVFRRVSDEFLRDHDLSNSHTLPGWKAFLSVAGRIRSAKPLFLEMVEKQRELAGLLDDLVASQAAGPDSQNVIQKTERVKTETEKLVKQQVSNLENGLGLSVMGDAVALLVATAILKQDAPADAHLLIMQYPSRFPGLMQAGKDVCVRNIYSHWIPSSPDYLRPAVVELAIRYNIPTGINAARKLLEGEAQPEIIELSLKAVELFGEPKDVDLAEKYLSNSLELTRTLIGGVPEAALEKDFPPGGRRPERPKDSVSIGVVRISDLALAVCMLLAKRDLEPAFPRFRRTPTNSLILTSVIDTRSLAFPESNPELRTKAMQAWREYRHRALKPM